jgi:type I restriction enzyme M protein
MAAASPGCLPAKTATTRVQHMVKSMAAGTGRMAVVLPHGALFRASKEGEIRKKILNMDLLDAVIGVGPNLFYGTGLAGRSTLRRSTPPTRSLSSLPRMA